MLRFVAKTVKPTTAAARPALAILDMLTISE